MLIEKKNYSIMHSVEIARSQAIAMAEKRVKSEWNEMVYSN
ncbi:MULTISPECIES: hypothetical protein [unclassified Bacillus (in: firmicutes)]|nr:MULTISPECIES: hypothetical protein [unclassified Bacillus (in: firmicutes)]